MDLGASKVRCPPEVHLPAKDAPQLRHNRHADDEGYFERSERSERPTSLSSTHRSVRPPATPQTSNKQDGTLSRLPHELLIDILAPIMVFDRQPISLKRYQGAPHGHLVASRNGRSVLSRARRPASRLDLLLLSKCLYFAGIEAFYGGNTIAFANLAQLGAFLADIELDRKQAIRSIRLSEQGDVNLQLFSNSRLSVHHVGPAAHDIREIHGALDQAAAQDILTQLPRLHQLTVVVEEPGWPTQLLPFPVKRSIEHQITQAWARDRLEVDVTYGNMVAATQLTLHTLRIGFARRDRRRWLITRTAISGAVLGFMIVLLWVGLYYGGYWK